jgi:hypothetical protein
MSSRVPFFSIIHTRGQLPAPSKSIHWKAMWPLFFVLFSRSIPPLFLASFISDVIRGPELLGFNWPMMGAFIALRKHYLKWILGIGLAHFAVGGVFLYLLYNADFIFL